MHCYDTCSSYSRSNTNYSHTHKKEVECGMGIFFVFFFSWFDVLHCFCVMMVIWLESWMMHHWRFNINDHLWLIINDSTSTITLNIDDESFINDHLIMITVGEWSSLLTLIWMIHHDSHHWMIHHNQLIIHHHWQMSSHSWFLMNESLMSLWLLMVNHWIIHQHLMLFFCVMWSRGITINQNCAPKSVLPNWECVHRLTSAPWNYCCET